MSSGIRAGIEIRGDQGLRPEGWFCVVPSVWADVPSNRTLFALLAGHATWLGLSPLVPIRDLPADISVELRAAYDSWHGVAFDANWVTFEELKAIAERMMVALRALPPTPNGHDRLSQHWSASAEAILAYMSVYHTHGYNTRLVFWFTPL